jgi:hypothetical protein
LDRVVAFYRDGIRLPEIDSLVDHDGYSGVMLDLPGTGTHLEFTAIRCVELIRLPTSAVSGR